MSRRPAAIGRSGQSDPPRAGQSYPASRTSQSYPARQASPVSAGTVCPGPSGRASQTGQIRFCQSDLAGRSGPGVWASWTGPVGLGQLVWAGHAGPNGWSWSERSEPMVSARQARVDWAFQLAQARTGPARWYRADGPNGQAKRSGRRGPCPTRCRERQPTCTEMQTLVPAWLPARGPLNGQIRSERLGRDRPLRGAQAERPFRNSR